MDSWPVLIETTSPCLPQDGLTPLYAASLGAHWAVVFELLGLQHNTDVSQGVEGYTDLQLRLQSQPPAGHDNPHVNAASDTSVHAVPRPRSRWCSLPCSLLPPPRSSSGALPWRGLPARDTWMW